MKLRRTAVIAVAVAAMLAIVPAQAATKGEKRPVDARELREWLGYIASDELQGRAVFSTGIGLAASYIEEHLRAWGVKPAGDNGSYLQTVRVLSIKATSHSSVTVEVGGERRTFSVWQRKREPAPKAAEK